MLFDLDEDSVQTLLEMLKFALLGTNVLLFLTAALVFFTSSAADAPVSSTRQFKRALIVTAHPDDESMFFLPLVHSLQQPDERTGDVWQTHLLCLSRGNADGLGDVREKELKACTAYLGLSSDRVQVLEDPQLQDGMKTHWDEGHIAAIVEEQLLKHNIDVVFTFDGYGVSGHANHIATHHGVKIALQRHQERCSAAAAADDEPKDKVVRGWELESTSLLRKYVGLLDTPLSYWLAGRQDAQDDRQFVFVFRPRWNYNAMALHRSQFVWYRRLFVAFSRYSFINTFRPLVPSDAISANQKKTQ